MEKKWERNGGRIIVKRNIYIENATLKRNNGNK
jgi:hypothetical protein